MIKYNSVCHRLTWWGLNRDCALEGLKPITVAEYKLSQSGDTDSVVSVTRSPPGTQYGCQHVLPHSA